MKQGRQRQALEGRGPELHGRKPQGRKPQSAGKQGEAKASWFGVVRSAEVSRNCPFALAERGRRLEGLF